ncbi:DUF4132 domain-containing protein [Roseobacter ponti]|uniref:DUF4132 domain-containing protein n=1 Tax=Roseobacter ponti TaxID=1891787 RepID=A0A858SRA9_9RHOB|nr:DUF4132 domain-containing protein [Roseobacter ponti]QJF50418.1 DUF4132 domain-containing protein [Roseobacter ponti]
MTGPGTPVERVSPVPKVSRADALSGTDFGRLVQAIDAEMAAACEDEYGYRYQFRPSDSESYKEVMKDREKAADLARFLFKNRRQIIAPVRGRQYDWDKSLWRGFAIFTGLMRSALPLGAEEILSWLTALKRDCDAGGEGRGGRHIRLNEWPVGFMVQAVERAGKKEPLSENALEGLRELLTWKEMTRDNYYGTDFAKVRTRVEYLIGAAAGAKTEVLPYRKLSGDHFGETLETELNALPPDEAAKWHRVFNLASGASGSKPTKKYLDHARELKDDLGKDWVRSHVQNWMSHALTAGTVEVRRAQTFEDQEYVWSENTVFTRSNVVLLKGLVWICQGFQDARTINLVADLCEKSMTKVPGVGSAAQATANACLWYLEVTPGAEATARLSRLSTAIKQKTVQKKVAEIVARKADAAGITTIQLAERVVPTYGLTMGEKSVAFDDYTLSLRIEGPGKITQTWFRPDGSVQKTAPKFVSAKTSLKDRLSRIKAEAATIKKVLTSQRDRIDRLFAEDVEWPLDEVEAHYVGHDLLCRISERLIWDLQTGSTRTGAIWRDGVWQDVTGAKVNTADDTTARLWHPIDRDTDRVMAWRIRLAELEIVQPTKQAFREVYHVTDAERSTRIYSNRMAAHMLRQHQMATLMAARGWRYRLMGAYDDGVDDQWATKDFVTSDLTAEYLLHTNWDEDNWNDAGIYLYVGTDQLRFSRGTDRVPLEEVPPRLLSETLREADLFVGVASVGNDPAWADQGPTPEARNYWQSYSFGELDGFAETRREVLQAVLPRLRIRDVAHIEGRFLIVDGRLNTYKIHLGSSNVLMAPGDRYLCIVPGRVTTAGQVALPFEGDTRLSVILSKAMMLADDDKIEAPDIVSQPKR